MRIFGVDPGSACTGYGCIETAGSRHRLVVCGALSVPVRLPFAEKLLALHTGLAKLLSDHRPDAVAVEDLFYAKNARSALKLGHVRGVLLLAASQADIPIAEYTPTQVKRAVVGYGRAAKHQVQEMVSLLLALDERPSPSTSPTRLLWPSVMRICKGPSKTRSQGIHRRRRRREVGVSIIRPIATNHDRVPAWSPLGETAKSARR